MADCVIILDQRIHGQISTRRLRVLKYRGTAHGTNEYPFLIGERGLSVLPITSPRLDHQALHRASFYRRERCLSAARFRQPRRDRADPRSRRAIKRDLQPSW